MVTLYSATSVDPEIFQPILTSLLLAEAYLLIPRLVGAGTVNQVIEGNFIAIFPPCVGEDRIARDRFVFGKRPRKAKVARRMM